MAEESPIMSPANQLLVRVIARLVKNIFIDPSPLIANYSSHVWVLHSKPLADLQWDPSDYDWICPCLTLQLRSFHSSHVRWSLV